MMKYKIALAGNPNVGKSTIFNALTNSHQHTGNWPGKTVVNATGHYKDGNDHYTIYDLPGTYSLISHSKEEKTARDFLCFNNDIDVTVVVCNAQSLERSLNLALQILEITPNVILVINLMDEAKKKNININTKKLHTILNIPIITTTATYNKGLDELKKAISIAVSKKNTKKFHIQYNPKLSSSITKINKYLKDIPHSKWLSRTFLTSSKEDVTLLLKKIKLTKNQEELLIKTIKQEQANLSNLDLNYQIASAILKQTSSISKEVITKNNSNSNNRDRKIDKIITSKKWGIPIMLLILFFLFWLTISASNYPSEILSNFLFGLEDKLYKILFFLPTSIRNILIFGVYKTTAWVVGVMLPPMMIFFPLFTILEDIGLLPRIAFNMDNMFSKCQTCGKQCLTMCMGIGCNAVGVTGARIIDSKRERLLAIITNSFMPCNGRYPLIISVITMFLIGGSKGIHSTFITALILVIILLISILITFITCNILSKYFLKGEKSAFILELPDYRHIRLSKIILTSICQRTIFVLGRAILIAAPAGFILYLITNFSINGNSILQIISTILDTPAKYLGLDGVILMAFFLGIPANEIVLPIIIMTYLQTNSLTSYDTLESLKRILVENGWTTLTAICFIIFTVFHFPCSTTLLTIKKETNSLFYTFISFITPLIIGIILCLIVNLIAKLLIFIPFF